MAILMARNYVTVKWLIHTFANLDAHNKNMWGESGKVLIMTDSVKILLLLLLSFIFSGCQPSTG
jgi:hypothetical protein